MKNEVRVSITRGQLDEALCEWVEKHTGLTAAPDPGVGYEGNIDEADEVAIAAFLDVVVPGEGK